MRNGTIKNLKPNSDQLVPSVVHFSQIDIIDKLSSDLAATCKLHAKITLFEALQCNRDEIIIRAVRQLHKVANHFIKEGKLPESPDGYDSTIKLPSSPDQLDQVMDPSFLDENVLSLFVEEPNCVSNFSLEVLKLLLSISAHSAESYLLNYQPTEQSMMTFTSNFYHMSARKFCSEKLIKHLSKVLFTINDENNPIWIVSISILKNFATFASPLTFPEILISIIGHKISSETMQLCYILVTASLSPNEHLFNRDSTYLSWISFVINFCKLVLNTLKKPKSLVMACDVLMVICEKTYGIELVLDACILNKIIQLAKANNEVSFTALSVIAKMAFTANTDQIVDLSQHGVPDALMEIISNPKTNDDARARACNALGNLGCETQEHVERLINLDAFPILIATFQNNCDYNTKIEAAYAVCACASRGSQDQVGYIISSTIDAMGLYVEMLNLLVYCDASHPGTVKLCKTVLCALENIFSKGIKVCKKYGLCENPYVTLFKQAQGIPSLLRIETFPDYSIAVKSRKLVERYL